MEYTYEQAVAAGKKAKAKGDYKSANEIAAYIDQKGLKPVSESVETPISDYLMSGKDSVLSAGQEFMDRGEATQQQFGERVATGLYGPPGMGVSDTAHVAAAGVEYAAGRGLDALATVTPEPVKEYLSELVSKGLTAGLDAVHGFFEQYPEAYSGLMELKGGYDKFSTWLTTQRPGLAADMQAVFDIGSIAVPAAKMGPIIDPTLGKAGQRLNTMGTKQKQEQSREGIRNLIYPENKIGEGTTDEAGILRSRTYEGSERENEIAEAMLITDKLDGNRTLTWNQARAYEAVKDYGKEVRQIIMRNGNPSINKNVLVNDIADALESLGQTPGTEMLVGDTLKMAENLLGTAMKLMDGTNGRAASILKARQEFDKIVRRTRGDQFDSTGQKDTAIMAVNRIVRDAMNKSVRDALGPEGDDVYHAMRQQHLLLEGADTLRTRMIQEKENLIKRATHNVARALNLPRTPLALGTTAAVGYGLMGGTAGVALGTTASGLLAAYGLKKGATSPTTKKALGGLLTKINEAIKATENSAMVDQLKADRLLLIEYLRETTSEEERPPLKTAANE